MSKKIRKLRYITGIEYNQVSSQIFTHLYPDMDLHTQGFETLHLKKKFVLVIGNPPSSSQKLFDSYQQHLKDFCIHHYIAVKDRWLLKLEGLLAMILPCYFLNNRADHVREIMGWEGRSLLVAYCLPDDFFQDAKVTVDFVFFKKEDTSYVWVKTKHFSISEKYFPGGRCRDRTYDPLIKSQ